VRYWKGAALGALLLAFFGAPALAQAQDEYSQRGADSCLRCHNEKSEWNVVDIFKTKHGSRVDSSAPMGPGSLQCEACHGPGGAHEAGMRDKLSFEEAPIMNFGQDAHTPISEQNQMCLDCHNDQLAMGWHGSAHDEQDTSCSSCHQVHVEHDPMFDAIAQQEVCFECHQRTRSQTLQPSNHPLRFGEMDCSSCHNPHNGNNDHLLTETNINDTCYECHAEKRGPFLWEHAPVAEDCTNCHRPHGSNHAGMLTQRQPLLCQQCHMPSGHPAIAYTEGDIEDTYRQRFLLGSSCGNCHAQVHGSNHPSGVYLGR
jgi:DmsE family decaheme c-type cytochrome